MNDLWASHEPEPPHVTAPTKVCPACSTQHQTASTICPWCGASYQRAQPPAPRPPPAIIGTDWGAWGRRTAALTFAALVLLWFAGTLDRPLSTVGLNRNPCVRNLITGATFCGDDAKELCRRIAGIREQLRSIQASQQTDACDSIDY